MAATTVSLEEYLRTTYEPDMEYVDGVLAGRNVGTQKHSLLQLMVGGFFLQLRKSHRLAAFTEGRLLVSAERRRYRIPDVMVLEEPFRRGRVVTDVPAIVIEIKSPEDTLQQLSVKCREYFEMGVPNIVVLDPDEARQFVFSGEALNSVDSITLHLPQRNLDLALPVAEMFAEIGSEQ